MTTLYRNQGYTLIEIVVVILIISLVTTITLFNIRPNHSKQMITVTRDLTQLMSLASKEALLRSATLGLGFSSHAYQFFIYSNQDSKNPWQAITRSPLNKRVIPPDILLSLKINGETVPLQGQVHIMISPNGDITPFTLLLSEKDKPPYYQLTGLQNGTLRSQKVQD